MVLNNHNINESNNIISTEITMINCDEISSNHDDESRKEEYKRIIDNISR